MSRSQSGSKGSIAVAFGAAICLSACAVVRSVGGEPSAAHKWVTSTAAQPGSAAATREQVEGMVGVPLREWDAEGVHYAVYRYDEGVPRSVGDAGAHAFMDGATLGLWELAMQMNQGLVHTKTQALVGYDPAGRVVCVMPNFGDLDEIDSVKCTGRASGR